jgi:hypothetical protein
MSLYSKFEACLALLTMTEGSKDSLVDYPLIGAPDSPVFLGIIRSKQWTQHQNLTGNGDHQVLGTYNHDYNKSTGQPRMSKSRCAMVLTMALG